MQTTKLSALFVKLNFFKDIEGQSDLYKVIALDDGINEMRRDGKLPWTVRKSTLKIFKGIDYYAVQAGHDELLTLNENEVDSYGEAAAYLNTDLSQFIEMVKAQRNLLTQLYINGEKALGVKNIQADINQYTLDAASDADDYSAVSGCTKVGLSNVYKVDDYTSIAFNATAASVEIKNIYDDSYSDANYLDKYYIRRMYLTSVPTSIELRLQTDDDNYISVVATTQANGLPFVANAVNYIGFAMDSGTEEGSFDNTSIASSKILLTGYTAGMLYVSYDTIDEYLLQQYWFYSIYCIISSGSSAPDKENFLDYDSNDYTEDDELVGDKKWIDTIVKKARKQLLLGIENEYLRNSVSKNEKKAVEDFNSKFPDQSPSMTTVTRRFDDNPEEKNYVP